MGRAEQQELITRLVDDGVWVVVTGEAGIGKTTVLRACAAATGRRVFEGGAHSTLSWMDHVPLRRALGRAVGGTDAEAVAGDVERTVAGGVLLLDDLQWADTATLEVVQLLAGRVDLLAGVRTGQPGSARAIDTLRAGDVAIVELSGLGTEHATDLVQQVRPDLTPSAVLRLVRDAGGNPLLLHELAVSGEPSPSLRRALAARLRLLDAAARDAFGMLALAGRPLRVDALGDVETKSLIDAGLAVLDGDVAAPRHALLAEVAIDLLDDDETTSLHARLARISDNLGEAARHHALAHEAELAHAKALRAAHDAERLGERASHLAIAASTAAAGRDADALRLQAAQALAAAEDWPGVEAVLESIVADDVDTRGWVALLRARAAWYRGDGDDVRRWIEHGLRCTAGSGTEIEVHLRIEQVRIPIFIDCDIQAGVVMAQEAVQLARRTGIGEHRAEYLLGTAMSVIALDGWSQHLERALERARQVGDVQTEFRAANNLVNGHESAGSPAVGREIAARAIDRARSLGLGLWERGMRARLVNLDFHAGRYEGAIDEAEALLGLPLDSRSRDGVGEMLVLCLIDLGRTAEAERRMAIWGNTTLPDHTGANERMMVAAENALWSGRPRQALEAIEQYLAGAVEGDNNVTLGQVTRAWACVECGVHPGPPVAPQHLPMLRAAEQETAALAALFEGDAHRAADQFDEAAALWEPYHRRGEMRCLWAAAESIRRSGDVDRAVARLETVEARALELGMQPLLVRIRQSLRAAGRRRSAQRGASVGVLTSREREVLDHVAGGLSNREIANRLGISRRTVEAQVSSATAKLLATGRTHAAAIAEPAQTTPRPLMVLDRCDMAAFETAVSAARAAGWEIAEQRSDVTADATTERPRAGAVRPASATVVATTVDDRDGAARAVLAAIAGAGLIVRTSAPADIVDQLCDDLRHLGAVEHRIGERSETAALSDDQRALLGLLLGGASLGAAARALHLSRRTADRRLAEARHALGTTTTSEAVVAARRLGLQPTPLGG